MLNHPFIVKLNHCFETHNFVCFVLDCTFSVIKIAQEVSFSTISKVLRECHKMMPNSTSSKFFMDSCTCINKISFTGILNLKIC